MINIYSHENLFYPVILSFILFLLHCLSALVIPILDQDHTKVLAVLLVREKKKSNAADSTSSLWKSRLLGADLS